MRIIIIIMLASTASLGFPTSALSQSNRSKIAADLFKAGVRVLTGAAAAESMRRAGNFSVEHTNAAREAENARTNYEQVEKARIEAITQQLRYQNAPLGEDCIYSIFLNVNYNVGSVYWADTFSNPDIFFVVEVEGTGESILPFIRSEYKGGPILDRIVARELPAGSRVVIRVMDDDTSGNAIWEGILRSRINYNLSIGATSFTAGGLISARAGSSGEIQVLAPGKNLLLDGPDHIASVTFQVPDSEEKSWVADGELRDSSNRFVGTIQFSQIWNRRAETEALAKEMRTKVSQAEKKESDTFGGTIFWGVLALAFIAWYFSTLINKGHKAS